MKENLEKEAPVLEYQLPGTECAVISDQLESKCVQIHSDNMSVIFNKIAEALSGCARTTVILA